MATDLSASVAQLRGASRRVVRQLGMLGPRTGHSHSQCHALLELSRSGTLTPAELAQRLELDRSTVSRLTAGLVKSGRVTTWPHPHDGRSKALGLTQKGRREVARIDAAADEQVSGALAHLDPTERDTVVVGMSLYARALARGRADRDYRIAALESGDAPAMARIVRQVMTEFGAVGCGFSIEDAELDDLFDAYRAKDRAFFVARRAEDGEVVGGAAVAPLERGPDDTCELRKMYLVAGTRGTGLGRRLLERCLTEARALGFTRCYLETLDGMDDARRLYEKAGFKPLDARLGATGHGGCNAWMILSL